MGGIPTLAKDSVLYFPIESSFLLSSMIQYLLNNKKFQKKLTSKAYKIIKKYTWEDYSKKLIRLYKNVL